MKVFMEDAVRPNLCLMKRTVVANGREKAGRPAKGITGLRQAVHNMLPDVSMLLGAQSHCPLHVL